MGQQNSYMTFIGVHSTMHLMHPDWCHVTIMHMWYPLVYSEACAGQ